jgi:predicted amidohydrolase YtcJ
VRGGRIAAVDRAEDMMHDAGASTRRIDLAGRTLVPGLNDAHAHIWKIGHLLTTMLDPSQITRL